MAEFVERRSNVIQLSPPGARGEVFTKLMKIPGVQMIYVSALACTRHRNVDFIRMQRAGRLSFLLFQEVDMITGDYIQKTKQAAAEIAAERSPSGIILLTGCQSALLSTDYNLLSEEMEQEIGCPVRVHDGCRLCGFDEESGASSAIDRVLYAFIRPAEKSPQPSVNILGTVKPDRNSELFEVLERAGVKQINHLADCETFEDYQKMGCAHLNILTSAQDVDIGQHLQEKLNIPYVCLGGIYDSEQLQSAYETLSQVLHTDFDAAELASQLEKKLQTLKQAVGSRPIAVSGDVELAKWLLRKGFPVQSLTMGHHQGLSPEQEAWFREHAGSVRIGDEKKGGPGGGRGPGGPGGRGPGGPGGGRGPGGPGGGRGPGGGKPAGLRLGFAGSFAALKLLEDSLGGAQQ